MKKTSALATAVIVACGITDLNLARAADGTWTSLTGGSWATPGNWAGGTVAGGTDAVADFSTLNITANRTVTLDGDVTVGHLLFGDATGGQEDWIIGPGTGGALILATTSGMPTMTMPLARNNNNFSVFFDTDIQGTQGVMFIGDDDNAAGRFQFRIVPKTYSGHTVLTNGAKLRLENSLPTGGVPDGPGKGDLYIWNGAGGAQSQFTINQVDETINGLWGNGQIEKANAVNNTLSIGNNDVSSEFTGTLSDGGNVGFNLRKIGNGTFTFNGGASGTFTGALIADGGTLVIGPNALIPPGSTLAAGAGILNLNSANLAATTDYSIGGNGPVIGTFTLNGLTLNPGLGSTPGTLILSNSVTCGFGATNVFDLYRENTVGGGVNDLLIINGNLDFASQTLYLRFRFPEALPATNVQYTIIKYTGQLLNGSQANLVPLVPAYITATLDTSVANEIRVTFGATLSNRDLTWNAGFSGTWDEGLSLSWLQGVTPVLFASGDRAWFTNDAVMGPTNEVAIAQAVLPGAVTVGGTNEYVFSGPGYFVGEMNLTNLGPGALSVSNAHRYDGVTYIQGGTLRVFSTTALGRTNGATIVAPGGTLDLNANIGAEPLFVAGEGAGGQGAVTRTGVAGDNSARNITLTGDATFAVPGDRYDIQADEDTDPVVQANGFKLTKIGPGVFGIAGVASSTNVVIDTGLGDIEVREGVQQFGWGVTLGQPDKSLILHSNSTLRLNKTGVINASTTNILVKKVYMTNATINPQSSGGNFDLPVFFGGPIEVTGENIFQTANNLGSFFYGPISGPGSIRKTGGLALTLTASNSFAGPLIIVQNKVVLANSNGVCLAEAPVLLEGTNGNAYIDLGAHDQIKDTTVIQFVSATAGDTRFGLRGYNETIAGVHGNNGGGTYVAFVQTGVGLEGDSNLVSTLTLNTPAATEYDFGGTVRDYGSTAPDCVLHIVKDGPGTQIFSGPADLYTGTTTIKNGTLAFRGSAAGGSPIVLQGGTIEFGGPAATRTRTNSITGTGTLVMDGAVALDHQGALNFTGATVLKGGRLAVNSTLGSGSGTVTVQGGTLAGSGTITDPVTVQNGGTLAPGNSSGSLTIGSLVLEGGSTTIMELDKFSPTIEIPDQVIGLSAVTYGGTLQVVDITTAYPLALGDEFQLFSAGSYNGSFTNIILPTLSGGLGWSNSVATDGYIRVIQTGPANPTDISWAIAGGQITLSWPASYTGWSLQVQTNQLSIGLTNNWVTLPGSDQTNSVTLPIDSANPAVFYRMSLQP